jgi:RNA polymerase sigma-70 factor (ECF subfamily)
VTANDELFAWRLSQDLKSGVLPTVTTDEQALVDGLRRGDGAAFDHVYAAYHARVHAFLVRLSCRHDTAEDLAQETWMKLAKAAPTLREDTKLAALLFTIARNAFLSHRRWAMLDLSRLVVVGFESVAAAAVSPDATPDEAHERARAIRLLERALAALPVASREVLLLVGVEGLGQEEVARVLGLSYDALRKRLSRARAELAEKMQRLESKEIWHEQRTRT